MAVLRDPRLSGAYTIGTALAFDDERVIVVPDACTLLDILAGAWDYADELIAAYEGLGERLVIPSTVRDAYVACRPRVLDERRNAAERELRQITSQMQSRKFVTFDGQIEAYELLASITYTAVPRYDARLQTLIDTRTVTALTAREEAHWSSQMSVRYAKGIPPGHNDGGKPEDLLVFREIINICSARRRSVIFVTEDFKDWASDLTAAGGITLPPSLLSAEFFADTRGSRFHVASGLQVIEIGRRRHEIPAFALPNEFLHLPNYANLGFFPQFAPASFDWIREVHRAQGMTRFYEMAAGIAGIKGLQYHSGVDRYGQIIREAVERQRDLQRVAGLYNILGVTPEMRIDGFQQVVDEQRRFRDLSRLAEAQQRPSRDFSRLIEAQQRPFRDISRLIEAQQRPFRDISRFGGTPPTGLMARSAELPGLLNAARYLQALPGISAVPQGFLHDLSFVRRMVGMGAIPPEAQMGFTSPAAMLGRINEEPAPKSEIQSVLRRKRLWRERRNAKLAELRRRGPVPLA